MIERQWMKGVPVNFRRVLLKTAETYVQSVAGFTIPSLGTGQALGPSEIGPLAQGLLWTAVWSIFPAVITFFQYMAQWIRSMNGEAP